MMENTFLRGDVADKKEAINYTIFAPQGVKIDQNDYRV